jgi:hypothetical protein
MSRRAYGAGPFLRTAISLALVLAAGCQSGPPEEPPKPEKAPEPADIQAVDPRDMAEQVSRRPAFQWTLPKRVAAPRLLSFTLSEAGDGNQPLKDEADLKRVAFASGLQTAGTAGLDPWKPPEGCVLTGPLREMEQLKGATWYRWSVRALGPNEVALSTFHFRTRAEDAAPKAAPDATPAKAGG